MSNRRTAEPQPTSISFYILQGAALLAFIRTFSLISPMLLSLLLVLLISLAVNPLITLMNTGKENINGRDSLPPTTETTRTIPLLSIIGGVALVGGLLLLARKGPANR
jgi:hypothetical protein